MRKVVRLRSDGSDPEFGLHLIVKADTGVTYEVQCNGHRCEGRQVEGFLVPVGGRSKAAVFENFFRGHFQGHPYDCPPQDWTDEIKGELRALVESVCVWDEDPKSPNQGRLVVDDGFLFECTEAWVPVVSTLGRGILVFNNCD